MTTGRSTVVLVRPTEPGRGPAHVSHALCGCQEDVTPQTALCGYRLPPGVRSLGSENPKCVVCLDSMRRTCPLCSGTGKASHD